MAPMGRMRNPAPKIAVVARIELISLPGILGSTGKNTLLMIGVMKAKIPKSNHSSMFPMTMAVTPWMDGPFADIALLLLMVPFRVQQPPPQGIGSRGSPLYFTYPSARS